MKHVIINPSLLITVIIINIYIAPFFEITQISIECTHVLDPMTYITIQGISRRKFFGIYNKFRGIIYGC